MPRIELIDHHYDAQDERYNSTIDVCYGCLQKFPKEGKPLPESLADKIDEHSDDLFNLYNATIGSLDVEHPPYDDKHNKITTCQVCDTTLKEDA